MLEGKNVYEVEVKVTVFETVEVEASSFEEAGQKALELLRAEGSETLDADCFAKAEVNSWIKPSVLSLKKGATKMGSFGYMCPVCETSIRGNCGAGGELCVLIHKRHGKEIGENRRTLQ